MITAASGVAGPGRSTAASIFPVELCHLDPIGEPINVVMLAGAFPPLDTNQKSRCARRVRRHRSKLGGEQGRSRGGRTGTSSFSKPGPAFGAAESDRTESGDPFRHGPDPSVPDPRDRPSRSRPTVAAGRSADRSARRLTVGMPETGRVRGEIGPGRPPARITGVATGPRRWAPVRVRHFLATKMYRL
jgi:hypothetical protein